MDDNSKHSGKNLEAGDLFSDTACLALGTMNKYLDGKLSAKDKLNVEKHLIDCEFCTEALEGLSNSNDRSSITESINSINEEIQIVTKSKKQKVLIVGVRQLVAASVAIIILVSVVLLINIDFKDPSQGVVAENIEEVVGRDVSEDQSKMTPVLKETDVVKDEISEIAQAGQGPNGYTENSSEVAQDLYAPVTTVEAAGERKKKEKEERKEEVKDADKKVDGEYVTERGRTIFNDELTNIKRVKLAPKTSAAGVPESSNTDAEVADEIAKDDSQPYLLIQEKPSNSGSSDRSSQENLQNIGLQQYNSGNYNASIKTFKKLLSKDPNNSTAFISLRRILCEHRQTR